MTINNDPFQKQNQIGPQPDQTGIEDAETSAAARQTAALLSQIQELEKRLEIVTGSRGYIFLDKLRTSRFSSLFVKAGKVLYRKQTVTDRLEPKLSAEGVRAAASHPRAHTPAEEAWIERIARYPGPLSINHPNWKGIYSSTSQLFDEIFTIPDNLNEKSTAHYARLLAEASPKAVVLQGFALSYYKLILELHRIAPQIPVFDIWHGNFLQANEWYAWRAFRDVEILCQDGIIKKWGFVKKGMEETMARRGLHTGFVMNYVRKIPTGPSVPYPGGPHLGLWLLYSTWPKPPYAMLAAASEIPSALVHTPLFDKEVIAFADWANVKLQRYRTEITIKDIPSFLQKMHLNLYVTFNECAPMLPLESLSVGVPCLIGATSHYFEDHEYLFKRLVVPQANDSAMIARYARVALEERNEIIAAYIQYAPAYNAAARACLEQFLEMPVAYRD